MRLAWLGQKCKEDLVWKNSWQETNFKIQVQKENNVNVRVKDYEEKQTALAQEKFR